MFGPFKFKTVATQELRTSLYEEHPDNVVNVEHHLVIFQQNAFGRRRLELRSTGPLSRVKAHRYWIKFALPWLEGVTSLDEALLSSGASIRDDQPRMNEENEEGASSPDDTDETDEEGDSNVVRLPLNKSASDTPDGVA